MFTAAPAVSVPGGGPGRVRDRIDQLGERRARVVVCTCSTIGDVAERAATKVPTLRVDRPMARRAVALGARIGVVAALESTLVPTKRLVEEEAAAAGEQPAIELVVVDGAWTDFEADDMVGYLHKDRGLGSCTGRSCRCDRAGTGEHGRSRGAP